MSSSATSVSANSKCIGSGRGLDSRWMFHVKQMESKAVDKPCPRLFRPGGNWVMQAAHDRYVQYHFVR